MEELRDLKQIYSDAANRFEKYDGIDFVLPKAFKDQVTEINSSKITYNDYSAIIETSTGQSIFLPNQWFYIASYFTDFYNELMNFKKEALKVVTKERLKDLNRGSLTDEELSHLSALPLSDTSKSYLSRFITDYAWWGGAKTIDRGDFYVSPILNCARLVNASQSSVADLCAFLADKQHLVNMIIDGVENKDGSSTRKGEMDSASRQVIYYGAPGTGKSHEIKEKTKDQSVIRTTFHPDSDYSTFVGCYKPTMKDKDDTLTIVELTAKLKEITMAVPPVSYPCLNFATKYWKSLLKLTPKEREDIIVACKFGTSYTVEVNKGMSIGEELAGHFKNESIVYRFVKQAFLKAYLLAWKNYTDGIKVTSVPVATSTAEKLDAEREMITKAIQNEFNPYNNIKPEEDPNLSDQDEHITTKTKPVVTHSSKPVYLIIEEINRGNCAQIFGDLFQLLDRSDYGFSEYPIEADTDLQQEIARAFKEDEEYRLTGDINVEGMVEDYTSTRKGSTLSKDIQDGHILLLPNNLYIWATMNTSDQSLFPIDSAFKRRWDWEYIPIKEHPEKNYKIEIGEKIYDWWGFLERINKVIGDTTYSEDKKLGYFFVKTKTAIVSDKQFVEKVLFYLWNDVFKSYGFDHTIFSKGDKDKFVFSDFFNANGTPNKDNVQLFLKHLEDTIKIDRPLDITPKEETTTVSKEATIAEA